MSEIFEFESPDGSIMEIEAPSREAAVKAFQRMRQPQQAQNNPMAFVNRGIAETLGAPVDVMNAGLGMVGLGSERPFLGSESIQSGMRTLDPISRGGQAVPAPGEVADTAGERVGQAVGQGAAALLPIGATGRLAQGGTGMAAGAAQRMAQPFVQAPAAATATELAASAGAGAGGMIGERAAPEGFEDLGRGLGEIAGGVGTGAASQAVGLVSRYTSPGALFRGFRAAILPFTRKGAETRAARRVQELSADPESAAQAIQEGGPGDLTPAQRTGDTRLLALERAILDTDAALDEQFARRSADATDELRGAIREPAQGETGRAARDFIQERRRYFLGLLDQRINQAMDAADMRAAQVGPNRAETDSSIIVRDELNKALEDAVAQERAMWGRVPRDARAEPTGLRDAFETISQETSQAQRGDIPAIARSLLGDDGSFGDVETVNELHGLYSELRRIEREARSGAAPNRNKARIANELAEAALRDIEGYADTPSEAGRAVRAAIDYSRDMHQTFTEGTVGKLLGLRREGGAEVPPERTLARSLGRDDATGVVSERELRRALGEAGPAREAQEDFLRSRFVDASAPRGEFNPDKARDFVRRHRETLAQYPGVRGDIMGAIRDREVADQFVARTRERSVALQDPKRSAGAAMESRPEGDEIASVLKARSPVQAARSLRAAAGKDPSGAAVRGLKGAFLDELMGRAKAGFDPQGRQLLSGRGILGTLRDDKFRGALNEILSRDEIQRVQRIGQELAKLETARGTLPNVPIIDDTPNSILSLVGRIAGARVGSQAGGSTAGGSLQAANIASSRVQKALRFLTADRAERLLRDAIQDPELFRKLLLKDTPANRPKIDAALTSWLGSLGVDTEQEAP